MDFEQHPTVRAYRNKNVNAGPQRMSKEWIKALARDAGADDVGVVEIDREDLSDQKPFILKAFPSAKTLVSLVIRMNASMVLSSDRSLIDGEFIAVEKHALQVSRELVRQLRKHGINCITPSEGFPQDMTRWPGRMFTVSHKPVAQAAGLGKIGKNRLLIHPEFGSHLCLGTMVLDRAMDSYDSPLDYHPCINCNLCVAVCPTGSISKNGEFNFLSCLVHAYRDRLGGFLSWTEALVTSRTMEAYREKRTDSETLAVWQALSGGGGYRCGYCMSVCPAGSDLIGGFIEDRKGYLRTVLKPLQDREEDVYLFEGTPSEKTFRKRFPNKKIKPV